jgi:DnaK suppressor protein
MNIAEQTRFKIMLLAHKEELQEIEQAAQGAAQPAQLVQTSTPVDTIQGQQMAQGTQHRRAQELARIDAALQRIANGSYGRCVQCDGDIDVRRLEVNPSITHCNQCAK